MPEETRITPEPSAPIIPQVIDWPKPNTCDDNLITRGFTPELLIKKDVG